MKILHTSDWHIGRTLNEKSLLEDQCHMIENIKTIIQAESPDVFVLAGDVYDRFVPSKEALAVMDQFLAWLILEQGIPGILIGGNHDGRERLDLNAGILKEQGLYIVGQYTGVPEPIVLKDTFGEVYFWCVPFIKPVEYRNLAQDSGAVDYDAMYGAICQAIEEQMDKTKRHVLISHGLILSGAEGLDTIDDSVRPVEIGGIDFARDSHFKAFDYTAIGHLHRPQKVGSDRVRYAGSPLKYSFSEWRQKKSVTVVELLEKGSVTVNQVPLQPLRDVRVITGTLAELTDVSCYDKPGNDDYLKVILEDTQRQINPMDKLRKVYPNIMEMTYAVSDNAAGRSRQAQIKERIENPAALFEDFYETIHARKPSAALCALVEKLLKEEDDTCGR